MTLLEDRLAAAGDQLDLLIDRELDHGLPRAGVRHGQATHRRTLTVAAVTVALLAGGLTFLVTGRGPTETPVSDGVPTVATPAVVDVETSDPFCAIDPAALRTVATTTDAEGRRVDYQVAELANAFGERLDLSTGGSSASWISGCGFAPWTALHPTGSWTNVASETFSTSTVVYVHGKLPEGSGPHEVTLTTGDAVPVTPTADGWFVATAVIAPVDHVDAVATTPVVPPSPQPTTAVIGVPTSLQPTTTLPIGDRPPLAIGESVMLGAAPQLAAGGFVVNADESRQGEVTDEIISQYRAAGQVGTTVVIQVGTNGPESQETYDEIMSHLPPEEVEQVIFLTVSAPRGWIEPNNALIWGLQERYPNVKVLDWAGLVVSGQVPGLAGDGIHLGTEAAKQWYANYIFDVMGRRDLVLPLPG